MSERAFQSDEIVHELRQLRLGIRRAAYVIAGGMVLSCLIAAGFFAPDGEVVWTLMVIAAFIGGLLFAVGSTVRGLVRNRIALKMDRERKAALSGRAGH